MTVKLLDPQKDSILKFYPATGLKQCETHSCKKNDSALETCYLKEN